jgi:REP element-mobilizing transposase RayT
MRPGQIELEFKTWGGKRKGAGRPPRSYRPSEPHTTRRRSSRLTALHVTLRAETDLGTLRRRDAFFALRKATLAVAARRDFRIVHVSPERDHVHLIVEADDDVALARGIQAFESSAAQRLDRVSCRAGKVFADRYHSTIIASPTQARHALSYVLNNWRHHKQDEGWDEQFWDVDYYSSAVGFDGWAELAERPFLFQMPPEKRLCVAPPRTWLLRTGWRKAGSISMREVPGVARGNRRG